MVCYGIFWSGQFQSSPKIHRMLITSSFAYNESRHDSYPQFPRSPLGRRGLQTTIIVKSVGKVAFFTSSFPSSPAPMLIKTLMFVRVIVLLYPNIEQGGRGIFSERENSLFSGLKWTPVKLYSLPNYFCL